MQEGVIKFELRFFPYPAVHEKNIACLNSWRNTLYEYNLIGQDPTRYDGAGFGNVSKRCPPFFQPCGKRRFFITGTQTGLKSLLTTEDYTTVLEYNIAQNMIVAEGPVKPSSESLTHGAIYDADDNIRYVFHTHSPEIWHNAKRLEIPVTHPDVEYGTVEMAQEVKRLFYHSDVAQKQIFSMGGHEDGIITFGRSPQQAGEIMLRYYHLSR
ncbi:class II aldolase/adducin family protein [Candidatus Uabimicrobium amorphum]|uniref:Aldolase n=1 Tax=Uabimicrobium amorphum TaxID=2596890 RepID=A0A5S9F334_UABAM|nr:class II aldolase/adducin family protein [Candidatus Uabimicrobium amorphum]BBM83733.1 aldolase [Candidatus Uabimicrobium amorphum]